MDTRPGEVAPPSDGMLESHVVESSAGADVEMTDTSEAAVPTTTDSTLGEAP